MEVPKIVKLIFLQERKAGFALWVFVVATYLAVTGKIDGYIWGWCAAAALTLFGGGNLADKLIDAYKPQQPARPPEAPGE